ncbi:DNA-processing protein DprA [Arcticibacter sp. MXS-1]|uniref:DNA-processing protein DprA n=1 Tax=Arcticibacter sp. MXS-1 TaxID=3341726 RepID=UPI0035A833B3
MPSLYEIALTLVPGVGAVTARTLLENVGDAESIFKSSFAELTAIPGVGPKTAESIRSKDCLAQAEKELAFVEKFKIKTLFYTSEEYPWRLRNCYDAPILLYYKGNAELNGSRVISVVGTRSATAYGRELTEKLIDDLASYDVLVISGLAYGIDGIAHKACLKHQIPTVGVVGHGLDRIYPAQHRSLAEKMLACGGILTEFPSGTKPDRENFPKRNRIVAGLADATIIVEAAKNGGALITAELANSYDRDVFAFPGRVNDQFSSGCNHLVKTNRANLITEAKDIAYLMGWETKDAGKLKPQLELSLNLAPEEEKIVAVLKNQDALSIDEIFSLTQISPGKLAMHLLSLEMAGVLTALPGKRYKTVG